MKDIKHLRILAREFPNKQLAMGEIIRLRSQLSLPKGTEYFFSDVHGEDKAFIHLMRSASGNIRRKIREIYRGEVPVSRQNQLANLIYDPQAMLVQLRSELKNEHWVHLTIKQLVEICKYTSSKYPREAIRSMAPERYGTIIEELLYFSKGEIDRDEYHDSIVTSIIELGAVKDFIIALCDMTQKICVNHIHLIGDIFDRGPGPHHIMEELIDFDQVDIQWGNHDIIWMGAALGNDACMLSVLRNALSYSTFDALEDGYSINLRALFSFAQQVYADDECVRFLPRKYDENIYDMVDDDQAAKMLKAVAIMLFKLEGQLIERHPEYDMDDRLVLKKIDYEKMTYEHNGVSYPLLDTNLPTVDPEDPLRLTKQEKELLRGIRASFLHSETLQRHMAFLYSHGTAYKKVNGNLLYHGCIPLTEDGEFDGIEVDGVLYRGKALMDYVDYQVTQAYYGDVDSEDHTDCLDFLYYLWCGKKSPMFGKSQMSTFENYFVGVKEIAKEHYNPYFTLSEREDICDMILQEFGLSGENSHIINGHVPVKIKDGESPMKANGKLFVIDGGIAKAYQKATGIAGYTMIFNSHHLALAEHQSFEKIQSTRGDYAPRIKIVDVMKHRLRIEDTDRGAMYLDRIEDLKGLLEAYTSGDLKENFAK